MTTTVKPTARPLDTPICAACGRLIAGDYYMIVDRTECYCPTCIATRPRCDNCGAPLGEHSWKLHDGRLQCKHCHTTAIYDLPVARALYAETLKSVAEQLGMRLNVGVEFRVVDAPTLRDIRAQDPQYTPNGHERTLGLYHRHGRLRVIYLLYGLPRLLFRTTLAHEYAHAWQAEYCPLLESHTLREGHAEWVAYRHLQWLGASKAVARMLQSNHPYRPALEHVLRLEQQLGTAGLIEHLRRAE
jgi:DNA-directed RNA polymerase subunit N (RpoN/RPB10)